MRAIIAPRSAFSTISISFIPGLADLTKAIHQAGALVCGQLNHRGMLLRRSVLGMEPVGPSPGKIRQPAMKSAP